MWFSLFLEGFRRPVRPPVWRNRSTLALSVSVIHVTKTCFSLFLEGFRRPIRPPLWRNRPSLAFSVPIIRAKKTWFSLFLEDFRRPVRPPVHAGALSVYDTREKDMFFLCFLRVSDALLDLRCGGTGLLWRFRCLLHVKKTCFSLFLEGFKRPVTPPLWRDRSTLALSVSVIHVIKTCFSLFLEGFRRPIRPPAVAESAFSGVFGACYT